MQKQPSRRVLTKSSPDIQQLHERTTTSTGGFNQVAK